MANSENLVTIILLNGEEFSLPQPASYSNTTSTRVDSGQSISGHTLGAIVREDVAQISMSWNYLEAAVWTKISEHFRNNYINMVKFFDQNKNGWDTREMYVSDRSAGIQRLNENGKAIGWTGCSLQFAEI